MVNKSYYTEGWQILINKQQNPCKILRDDKLSTDK